jgi:hypothetical protein
MSSLAEGRRVLIALLRDQARLFNEAVKMITALGIEHGAQLVSGVFDNVIDRCGNEHRSAQTGKNGLPNFLVRIGLGPEKIICTYCPRDLYTPIANRFTATPANQHSEPEQVMGIGYALKEDGPHFAELRLRSKLLRHVLVAALYYDIFPLTGIWGPSASAHRGRTDTRRKVLNKIVDELLKCGMTLEEIQQHFIKCLKFKSKDRPIDFVLKLACAKCFPENQTHHELSEVLRQRYFERFWHGIVYEPQKHDWELVSFGYLAKTGMVTDVELNSIRSDLKYLMAHGHLRQAYEIVEMIGDLLGLYDVQRHPRFCRTMGPIACLRDCVTTTLTQLAPVAYSHARNASEYGNAAALVHAFGASSLCDGYAKDVITMAHEAQQPVPMELCRYYQYI